MGTGSWTVYNIFRDHLGTITHLKTGSTISEYSFDAWGRRRDKDTWSYTLNSEPALLVDRGFTAHEYLEDFKLYNMNGRLYDPVVGRFLSPDPHIQDPSNTQSFNRYSYCLNNPLKYTDPSGEIPWLYFAGQLLGNYLFGVADNTINKKMPMNQAAKQFNFNMNYSPGNNSFSTPGIDAQMAAWNMDSSQDPAYTMSGSWRQVNAYAGAYDDAFFQGTTWKYVPGTSGQGGGYLDTANGWLIGAGNLSGAIGAIQIGMFDYRSSLPLMSKIGTFSKFSSTYRTLGTTSKVLGRASNWIGAPISLGLDLEALSNGDIGVGRFAYRQVGLATSIGGGAAIGSAFGGPWGAVGGASIGLCYTGGEGLYDGLSYTWNETLRQISNFNNGIKSGWYPGRY